MTANVVIPALDEAPSTVVGSTPQSEFDFDFPFFAAADIIVKVDGVALDPSAYTVEGLFVQNGDPVVGGYGSGTVTLNTPVSNVTVTIDRYVDGPRETQFSPASPIPTTALNAEMNKLTARQQDERRRVAAVEASLGVITPEVVETVAADAAAAGQARDEAEAAATEAAATLASAVVGVQYFGAVTPAATAAATVGDAYAALGRGGRLHVKQDLNVGAAYIENDGVELVGNPVYFDPSDGGGRRPLNYWGRERMTHFGREQLARLYYLLDQGLPVSIGMIGDSNTAGYVGTALKALLEGVSGVTVTDYAVGGTYEDEWLNETGTFAAGQANESKNFSAVIAAGHDAIINGYSGTNDAYFGRTATQFLATKRAALEAIRAEQGGVGAVGILQMTANAQHDGAGSRDPLFLSQVNAGIRQIVQDPGIAAAFFDKTAEFPDPFPSFASGGFQYRWIDSAGVHTQYGHTTILAQLIFEWLIPSCYRGSGNMAQVTPASGFTLPASEKMFVGKSGDNIVGGGYVSMTTPASLTLGQHIATLPSGYEPYARAIAEVALFNSGATPQWEYGVPVQILADGTITIGKASTQSPDRIYLVGSWSTLQSI